MKPCVLLLRFRNQLFWIAICIGIGQGVSDIALANDFVGKEFQLIHAIQVLGRADVIPEGASVKVVRYVGTKPWRHYEIEIQGKRYKTDARNIEDQSETPQSLNQAVGTRHTVEALPAVNLQTGKEEDPIPAGQQITILAHKTRGWNRYEFSVEGREGVYATSLDNMEAYTEDRIRKSEIYNQGEDQKTCPDNCPPPFEREEDFGDQLEKALQSPLHEEEEVGRATSFEAIRAKDQAVRAKLLGLLTAAEKRYLQDRIEKPKQTPYDESLQEGIRDKVFQGIFSNLLSDSDRDMLAMVWTALGEARGQTRRDHQYDVKGRAEMVLVMQVIQNRADYAKQPPIEIAFQPTQFSTYGLRDPNWMHALLGAREDENAERQRIIIRSGKEKKKAIYLRLSNGAIHRAYQAYQDFQGGYRSHPTLRSERTAHYLVRSWISNVSWARKNRTREVKGLWIELPPPPPSREERHYRFEDGDSNSHAVFHDLDWEYKASAWSKKYQKRAR